MKGRVNRVEKRGKVRGGRGEEVKRRRAKGRGQAEDIEMAGQKRGEGQLPHLTPPTP